MTPLFGPGWGNYAIQGIMEIQLPDPVPLRPETPGWGLLLVASVCVLAYKSWQRYRRYRRNAYRRESRAALEKLRVQFAAGDVTALRELAPLLRGTALQATGRSASVLDQGSLWQETLDRLAPQLPPLPTQRLHELAYAPLTDNLPQDSDALVNSLARWIEEHHDRQS